MMRVRWLSARLLIGAALVATGSIELSAQSRGPIKLFPDLGEGEPARPKDPGVRPEVEIPGRETERALPEEPSPAPLRQSQEVVVESLDQPSIDALGLSDGLDARIWAGADIDRVTRLIEELPAAKTNPALIDFSRRLLLTGAASGSSLAPGAMLAGRIEQLIRLGALDDAARLLEQIPPSDVDEPATRRIAELALWRGETEAACDLGEAVEASAGGTFWGKLRVFCRQVAGAEDEAELALALLRDSIDDADRRFVALAEGRGDKALETGEPWTALQVAMLNKSDGQLPEPALADPTAALVVAIARRPTLAERDPLTIAERAFLMGAIDRDRLIEIYAGAGPSAAPNGHGPAARAAVLRQIIEAGAPTEQARLFDRLWGTVPPADRVLTAHLFASELNALTPSQELLFAAPAVARALLAAGYPRPAAGWLDLVTEAAADDVTARDALATLRPLFAIGGEAGQAPRFDLAMLEAWRAAVERDPLLEARLLALAEATTGGLPLEVWWAADRRRVDPAPDLGEPVFWRVLESARQRGASGEAVLAGLNLLGGDPASAHPEAIVAGLGALSAAGFAGPARDIAAASAIRLGL